MKRFFSVILICVLLNSGLSGCKALYAKYSLTFVGAFDTVTVITGYDESREAFTKNARKIYDELYRYHQLFDIYNEYDDIKNLATVNKNAGQSSVKVDKDIIDLLSRLDCRIEQFLRHREIWHKDSDDFKDISIDSYSKIFNKCKEIIDLPSFLEK